MSWWLEADSFCVKKFGWRIFPIRQIGLGIVEPGLPGCSFSGTAWNLGKNWEEETNTTEIFYISLQDLSTRGQQGMPLQPCYWAEHLQSWCSCHLQRLEAVRNHTQNPIDCHSFGANVALLIDEFGFLEVQHFLMLHPQTAEVWQTPGRLYEGCKRFIPSSQGLTQHHRTRHLSKVDMENDDFGWLDLMWFVWFFHVC